MANKVEDMFDEMLEETVEQMASEEETSKEKVEKAQVTAKETLTNFLNYIRSKRFTDKCKEISKRNGLNHKIVKNHYISSVLGKIADVLHLAITITAELIKYAVEFLVAIINKIVEFTYNVCTSLVNLFTLNCGGAQ